MLGSTRPIRLHGKPIELEVRPRPAAAKGSDWLPARSLTLEHSLSADPATLHAGDPLTLHLHLRAAGLSGTQLPDLGSKLRLPDGVKTYPDQAKLDNSVEARSEEHTSALQSLMSNSYAVFCLKKTYNKHYNN